MNKELFKKAIIHLDMDAFYPAVEVLDNPALKGKPVIVGGSNARGVVSSASYEARKFGVHSALPIAKAMRLCPKGIFLPVRMSRYQEISKKIFKIFHLFTPLIEPVSIDEAFLDVTGSTKLFGTPVEIAKKIKQVVFNKTGLTVSAGVASCKFVAKIASDMDKPDGLTIVPPDRISDFLNPLSINKLWGIGKKTTEALACLNIHTFEDLSQMPVELLKRKFGKHGVKMHKLSMGIDERDVEPEHDVKSIGHEKTFVRDIVNMELAKKELLSLSNKVARRMRSTGIAGKTITLKVKYSDFVQITRSITLLNFINDGFKIYATSCCLLKKTKVGKKPVRLLGISLSQLNLFGTETQLSLFQQDKKSSKREKLTATLDLIFDKFGEKSVRPCTLLAQLKKLV